MKTVNKEDVSPVGGVMATGAATWLNDEILCSDTIDLTFENYMLEKPNDMYEEDWIDQYMNDESTYLIGFKEVNGMYEIDEGAEFSAIVNFPYTQIVHSRYMSYANKCSPCYPYQNDLDTPGDNETYQLPPDMFDDEFDEHLEIFEIV